MREWTFRKSSQLSLCVPFVSFVVELLLSQLSQIDSQLLALLIKVASLQPQGFCRIGDVLVVALDFVKDHLPLHLLHAFSQCPRAGNSGACFAGYSSPRQRGLDGGRRDGVTL